MAAWSRSCGPAPDATAPSRAPVVTRVPVSVWVSLRRVVLGALLSLAGAAASWAQSLPPHLDPLAQQGLLTPLGHLRLTATGDAVTPLANGDVLFYGNPLNEKALRRRPRLMPEDQVDTQWLWLGAERRWRRLPSPPGCQGYARGARATTLADGGVLLSGGVCDPVQLVGEPTPPPYRALQRWDAANRRWLAVPALAQGRLLHSAARLADGSVLMAGGIADPVLEPGAPPRLTVERWRADDNSLQSLAPLPSPRLLAAAVPLADGGLLLIGGEDEQGQPVAAVSRWQPDGGAGRWQALAPLQAARSRFGVARLPDGRVVVAGGRGVAGVLSSVEIYDPSSDSWTPGPTLPQQQLDATLQLLQDGSLLLAADASSPADVAPSTWVWQLDAKLSRWQPAGQRSVNTARLDDRMAGAAPVAQGLPDGRVRWFLRGHAWLWQPGGPPLDENGHPVFWTRAVTGLRLPNGHVLVAGTQTNPLAGRVADDAPPTRFWMWDPSTRRWSSAGELGAVPVGALLPIGRERVMHLSLQSGGRAQAHCATLPLEASTRWKPCGSVELAFDGRVGGLSAVGVLESGPLKGSAAWLPDAGELLVYRPAEQDFLRLPVQQLTEGQLYGAPFIQTRPLAVARHAGEDFDIGPLIGRLMEVQETGRAYDVVSGGVVIGSGGGQPSPRVHWDADKQRWTYRLLSGTAMGRFGFMLPDGCVMSVDRPTLFHPEGSAVQDLPDVLAGLSQRHAVPLTNGQVLVLGIPDDGGLGGGFQLRQASCDGWTPQNDDALRLTEALERDYVRPQDKPPELAKPLPLPEPSRPPARPGLMDRALPLVKPLIATVAIVGAALLLMAWLRRRSAQAAHRDMGGGVKAPATGWRRRLGLRITLPMRVVLYGGLAYLLLSHVLALRHLDDQNEKEACLSDAVRCVDARTGRIASVPRLAAMRNSTPPELPCRFIGSWQTVQRGSVWKITLDDQGRAMLDTPVAATLPATSGKSSYWMVQSGHFVWRHPQGVGGELDINRILGEDERGFVLEEMDGRHTRFDRLDAHPSTRCDRDRPTTP